MTAVHIIASYTTTTTKPIKYKNALIIYEELNVEH